MYSLLKGVRILDFSRLIPGAYATAKLADLGADVIGVDWRINLEDARRTLGESIAVQGNLDPAVLLGDKAFVEREAARIVMNNRGRPGHIFNLGHGILPDTPIENVEALVEAVRTGDSL